MFVYITDLISLNEDLKMITVLTFIDECTST